MAKKKKSSSDMAQESGTPKAEASFEEFKAEAKAEISISASIASASAVGIQFAFYLGRSIVTGLQNSYGIASSEDFLLMQEQFLGKFVVSNKVDLGIAGIDSFALESELCSIKSDISAVNSRITALGVKV